MRVRGDATDRLPASFYTGTNNFLGEPGAPTGNGGGPLAGDGRATAPGAAVPPEPSRDVVESDIWKIRGDTLYFFNQQRGLQIIDISNPDAPALQGTYSLPAAGEQMYTLGAEHLVLLARNGCYYSYAGDESRALIIEDNGGTPALAATVSVPGYIVESRLVGTALYVASQVYRPVTNDNGATWQFSTVISSFDLSNPAAPVSSGTLSYPGYGIEVAATDRYFFVINHSLSNWSQSIVHLIDISAADGAMRALGSVTAAGRIPDKFKVHVNGEVLTLISQVQTTMLNTKLETFSLADPMAPRKLGELTLGMSERLHATRFDGDRVYVVTFHVQFQIDPLWVVDLSDPARPAIKGELEIPGWSTFLQPLGNRLVALGIETNRTTVSLFDVADPARPSRLSRVTLGSGWSWSEGNWDEKAFNVLSDAGLILVPFQSWTTNAYTRQVQLIDLSANSLALRGVIDHEFQPRRATLVRDRVLSISARELLSVDATDRDHPEVRARLDLAWPVDRVFVHGDYLLELATGSRSWGWWWYSPDEAKPIIRVAGVDDPNGVLASFSLSNNLPIIGATKQGDYLYVAQSRGSSFYPWIVHAGVEPATNHTKFVLTVFALDRLPQLSVTGQFEAETTTQFWNSDLQALWPKPGVLVWVGGGLDFWWWRGWLLDAAPAGARFAPWPWFWPNTGGQLLACDVRDPNSPRLASEISLLDSNRWSFSRAFAAEGLVHLSHQTSEFVPGLETPWTTPAYTNVFHDPATGQTTTNIMPRGSWVQRYFLHVVDYADANAPTVRRPISISGSLRGLSRQGALLYAESFEWTLSTNGSTGYPVWRQNLDALAYDGVSAHLVDSLPLPNTWPHPLHIVGENIFLGRSGYDYTTTNLYPHYLETWTLPDTGRFTQLGRLTLDSPAQTLHDFPGILAAQLSDNSVVLFDLANPANLSVFGRRRPAGCLWFDLSHSDGNVTAGLWIPLGGFGVAHIPVTR